MQNLFKSQKEWDWLLEVPDFVSSFNSQAINFHTNCNYLNFVVLKKC